MIAIDSDLSAHSAPAAAVLVPHPGPIRTAIAALHDREMRIMPREDLLDMLRMSSMTSTNWDRPVEFAGLADKELTRVAFLLRRCCRNQLDAHRHQCGQPMLWREAI
jgi:hypothetical protein